MTTLIKLHMIGYFCDVNNLIRMIFSLFVSEAVSLAGLGLGLLGLGLLSRVARVLIFLN